MVRKNTVLTTDPYVGFVRCRCDIHYYTAFQLFLFVIVNSLNLLFVILLQLDLFSTYCSTSMGLIPIKYFNVNESALFAFHC